jgi:hypothetical protein
MEPYEEIGPNYRFFLAWRHAAFAGNIVVLGGTCSLLTTAYEKAMPLAWLIPLLASLAAVSLWLADRRTRQIYRSLTDAGKKMEGGGNGPYHALAEVGIPKDAPWFPKKDKPLCRLFAQSFALDIFFLGSALVLFLVAVFLMVSPPSPKGEQRTPNQSVQVPK